MNKLSGKIGIGLVTITAFLIIVDNLPNRIIIAKAISARVTKIKLPPPPNRGIAGHREASASRTFSPDPTLGITRGDKKSPTLTALVPEYSQTSSVETTPTSTKVWGLTTKEYPSFWFYIPYAKASIYRLDFVLKDGGKSIVNSPITPPAKSGLISYTLPPTTAPLEIGKLYQWELKMTMKIEPEPISRSTRTPEQITVTGWIQRADLKSQLRAKIEAINLEIRQGNPAQTIGSKLKQADLYIENGFWYDSLATNAELRREFPQDPKIGENWKDILTAVDLEQLVNRPFN
jgi:hypothetical protein